MNMKKLIGIWMIILVITIPMYSSIVMGASVQITSIKGQDGFDGFRKKVDTTAMEVDVTLEGDDKLTGNQLRTKINGVGPFTLFGDCDGSSGTFKCTSDRVNVLQGGKHTYEVILFDDDSNEVGVKDIASIIVDDIKPALSVFSVDPEVSTTPTVTVNFKIEDLAYSGNVIDCIGIKKLEILENDLAGDVLKEVDLTTNDCTVEDAVSLTASGPDGNFKICGRSFDRFDQSSGTLQCKTFSVDQSDPQVESFSLKDLDGENIEFAAGNVIGAVLTVNLTDNNFDTTSILADLTDVNGLPDTPKSSCQSIGADKLKCIWNFQLFVFETKSPVVTVKAKDHAGNELEQAINLPTITKDLVGPKVSSFASSIGSFEDTVLFGRNFNITAEIDDAVGVAKGNMFADFSGLGLSSQTKADICTKDQCTWEIKNANPTDGVTVTIRSSQLSEDDLGNRLSEVTSFEGLVDNKAPVIENVDVDVTQSQLDLPEGFAIRGDKVIVKANITEKTSVSGQLISNIFGDVGPLEGTCERKEDTNEHQCTWESPPIESSGPFLANLFFSFKDFSGNTEGITKSLFISQVDDDEEPNYYSNEVFCSPSFIDRQISEKISVREHCHIVLSPIGVEAVPIITELEGCQGDGVDFILDAQLSNNFRGSKHPLLSIDVDTVNFDDTNVLNLTCDLSIHSEIAGDSVNINPEIEQVEIRVPISSFPLGEFSEEMRNEIEDAIDATEGPLWNTIGILKKIFDYGRKICFLFSAFANLKNLYHEIQAIWDVKSSLSSATPLGAGVEAGRKVQAYSTEAFTVGSTGIMNTARKFCLFLNCQLGPQAPGASEANPGKKKGFLKSGGGFLNFFGGGGGFGAQPRKWGNIPFLSPQWLEDWTGRPIESYLNGRDSAIIALLTLCIPGIVNAIDKARQINCMYALCLESSIDSNIPASVCDDQKDYMYCKWVVGEIFAAIPFTAFFNYYIEMIKNVLSDPLAAAGVFIGYICAPAINGPPFAYNACAIPRALSLLGQAIQDVTTILDFNFWKIQTDYCDQVSSIDDFDDDEDFSDDEDDDF